MFIPVYKTVVSMLTPLSSSYAIGCDISLQNILNRKYKFAIYIYIYIKLYVHTHTPKHLFLLYFRLFRNTFYWNEEMNQCNYYLSGDALFLEISNMISGHLAWKGYVFYRSCELTVHQNRCCNFFLQSI